MIDTYIHLFLVFFKIGIFGFGGGYPMLSLIQFEVVETYQWLNVAEFTNIVALSQMTPGPISINCATYVGYTVTGGSVLGSVIATFAVCLPSVIIMALMCRFFFIFKNNRYVSAALQWMKPAAIGLIAAAALLLMNEHNFIDWRSIAIAASTFAVSYFFKADIILSIVLAGVAGYLLF
ncbi:MAG: chromate transporter [Tannerella sp.]|jgi:chromate transporter|nr:chromate transporter [Tannerella sp.]